MAEDPASAETSRSYFRVPCELQIRFRRMEADELTVFKSFGMRPSPYSSLKSEIENQIGRLDIREESKMLFEKAFQILLNIDQRLERMEERLDSAFSGEKKMLENYEWVHGDLSAGGLAFATETAANLEEDTYILLDMILPSLPEYRIVAAAKVVHSENKNKLGTEFISIHEEDREFIHRFVVSRERELLRARAIERDRRKQSGS